MMIGRTKDNSNRNYTGRLGHSRGMAGLKRILVAPRSLQTTFWPMFVFHGRDGLCAQLCALPYCSTRSVALDEAAVARTGRGECQRSRIGVISGSPLHKTLRRAA